MTYQEILEGITRHPLIEDAVSPFATELKRKIDEIEWALHASVERAIELEEMTLRHEEILRAIDHAALAPTAPMLP
jgi:hypothetical protein